MLETRVDERTMALRSKIEEQRRTEEDLVRIDAALTAMAADVEAGWSWYLDRLGATLHDAPMPAWTGYAPAENPAKEQS